VNGASDALTGAKPAVFWVDDLGGYDQAPVLTGSMTADLVIVGAGFSGLWAANIAVAEDPTRSIVVIEAERTGHGASSRNGGFLEASLTHGVGNGLSRWPGEMETIERLAGVNYRAIIDFVELHGLDVGLEQTGVIHVASQPWHLEELEDISAALTRSGDPFVTMDRAMVQAALASPTYIGAVKELDGTSIVHPAKLVMGLRSVAEGAGVKVFDRSPVISIARDGRKLKVSTEHGAVSARKVIVATNAYAQPIRRMRRYVVPVYDYVLMTEPLTTDQMGSIGWEGREGISDVSNQFHYYRLTSDNRILWGGYDAVYRYGNAIGDRYDQAGDTHALLADHFFTTFPQLEGLRFSHKWAGPIGTTTRFTATWGRSHDDDVVWVGGYTGLGVGASRFGAQVALDLVDGIDTERTQLEMVRRKPLPFPPEPIRYLGISMTRRALARSDENEGKRGPWLRLLDRLGMGFDS
jgi:glycine/D-amino acid oxidase-like deaminating enzyme